MRAVLAGVLLAVSVPVGCTSAAAPPEQSRPAERLLVSLTFNDGLADQYAQARPLLDARGLHGTFYLTSSWLDRRWACCMAWWQVDELYRAGHEIGSMGTAHENISELDSKHWARDLQRHRQEVCADRRELARRGYAPVSFAYPGGAYAAAFPDGGTPQDLVRGCGWSSARAVGGLAGSGPAAVNALPPADPYAIRTPDALRTGPVREADLRRQVTAAALRGGWLPLAFDHVCAPGTADYAHCMQSGRPVDARQLAGFLDWLAAAGRPGGAPAGTVVRTVREALGGAAPPPLPVRRTVVSLTFDGATRAHYLARTALLDHDMRATFFVNSALVDRADGSTMTWPQIRSVAGDGNDVGGQTLTHVNLTALPPDRLRREVCADRARITEQVGPPVSFAYPYGAYNADVERTIRSCGYESARTTGGVSPAGPVYGGVLPPVNPYATPALTAVGEGPIQLGELITAVRATAGHGGGWVQIAFNRLCRNSDRDYASCMRSHRPVDVGAFGDFLDWLGAAAPPNTVVRTVREAVAGD
jgi:peptidoglycan/xylan/chitin deacetylase (PgdA/CDA1 family)